jgi:hypothetical protein
MTAPQALFVALGLALCLARAEPAAAGPAAASDPRDITVSNRAHRAMNQFYISPVTSDSWGDDRLGEATIEPGQARRLRLTGVTGCDVDIQVVYDDASHEERHGVDICRTRQLVFDGSAAVVPAAAKPGTHQVVVVNDSPLPIQQVLIAPADAPDWGDDLLQNGSLSSGDRITVTYHGDCLADLRVVFDNRSAEERRNLDFCGLHGVVVRPGWTTANTLPPLPGQPAGKPGP